MDLEQQIILSTAQRTIVVSLITVFLSMAILFTYRTVLYVNGIRRKRKFMRKNLPHLRTVPFFGHLTKIPRKLAGKPMTEFIISIVDKFPRMYCFFFGPWAQDISLPHPETVKIILKTSEPKSITHGPYQFLQKWLGDGLLLSSGKTHFRNRRLMTPAFHFDVLRPYMDIYNQAANTLIGKLNNTRADGDKSVEIYQPVSLCTLEVILKCAFSFDQDVQLGDQHPYVVNVINVSKLLVQRLMSLHLHPNPTFYMSPTGYSFRKSRDYIWSVARDIISKRRKMLDRHEVDPSKKYKDFLDILLLARDEEDHGMTEEEIRQEVDTFLFEGHDTTASAISWCLHALAEHPDAQTRARDEVDQLLGGRDDDNILWDDLQHLPYLTMCIKESLRRTPPVPFIMRELTQPLEIDAITIPAGIDIAINIYGLHHNRTVWGDDHREYKPERFTPERMKAMDSHAFIGFSAGPRNCIGQNFAMHELKVIIGKIIHRFELSVDPAHEAEVSFELVMRAYNGIKLFLKPRH